MESMQFSHVLKHSKSQQQKTYKECNELLVLFLMYEVLIKSTPVENQTKKTPIHLSTTTENKKFCYVMK